MPGAAARIANEFLNVVWNDDPPDDVKLLRALDKLLLRAGEVPSAQSAEGDGDPPESDGSALFREVARRFPGFGMYPVADPLGSIEDDQMLGDAVDDLADITKDLREVIWRDEHLGPDDAAWCFRLLYFHWARHARELALYLHAKQFE